MALVKAVALAAGGVAAAAVLLVALFIYKMVATRKAAKGGKARLAPQKAVYESPRPNPNDSKPRRESPAHDEAPARQKEAKDTVVSVPPPPPLCPPRNGGASRQSPFAAQPPNGLEPTSGSRDLPSTDESVWQCPTWEAMTGENWSIGTSNYVYNPNAFFISGDIAHDIFLQQGAESVAENKARSARGAVDEWGHRYDAVSSWVEDSKGGGWRPVQDDEDGSYSSRVDNPLFTENSRQAKAESGQGRMVSSWVEDSAGGGWKPVDKALPQSARQEGAMPGKLVDSQGSSWKDVEKDDHKMGTMDPGGGPSGQEGTTHGRVADSQGGGWRAVDRDGLPSARQMGRVMDSWVEDSQGGGWRPVDKDGLPSARQMGRVMDSWVEDSQGGGWRPVDRGVSPSARHNIVPRGRVVDSWVEDSQGGGWMPVDKNGLPPSRQGARVVDSWVEDSQGGGWRPVDKAGLGAGVEERGALRRPLIRGTKPEGPRWAAADRVRQAVESPRDEELPVSCSLPGDFDFIHRGSDDWDMDSNMSTTVMPAYALSSPSPAGVRGRYLQTRAVNPNLDSAATFSFNQAPMERTKSLGESISSIEEGRLPKEPEPPNSISIKMAHSPSVPGLKPEPDYHINKPVPQCPEPMSALSVSSAEDSNDEMVSPVMGQGRPAPGGRPQSPVIELKVCQMAVSEEKTFTSPFFNTSNSYFSREDQVDGIEDGLSAYSLSSVDEIDLCVRSQEAVKRLDGSIWVDNALFDTAPKADQKAQVHVHGVDNHQAYSPALVSM